MESEDKTATTAIAKTDVKAVQPMTKPVTARPAEGLPEHPMSLAQEFGEPPGGADFCFVG